jgi:hypothetical protein
MTTHMQTEIFLADAALAVRSSFGRTPANECPKGDVPALAGGYAS